MWCCADVDLTVIKGQPDSYFCFGRMQSTTLQPRRTASAVVSIYALTGVSVPLCVQPLRDVHEERQSRYFTLRMFPLEFDPLQETDSTLSSITEVFEALYNESNKYMIYLPTSLCNLFQSANKSFCDA